MEIKYLFTLVCGVALLGLAGCTDYITLQPDPADDELTAFAYLYNEAEYSRIRIDRTLRVDESGDRTNTVRLANPAEVVLYKDDQPYATFTPTEADSSLYHGEMTPITPGDQGFTLVVNHPDFPTMSATADMPNLVPLTNFTYSNSATLNGVTYSDLLKIEFDDPPGEANFYEFNVQIYDSLSPTIPRYFVGDVNLNHVLLTVNEQELPDQGKFISSLFTDDALLDGGAVTWWVQLDGVQPYLANQQVELNWRNITPDQYQFVKSMSVVDNTLEGLPFGSESIISYNFDQGYGFFGLIVQKRYRIQ